MVRIISGWAGRFFEDFEVGDLYIHPYGRTITETDNIWFSLLTNAVNEIHFNRDYASKTGWSKPLVNSAFTLAVVTGMSVMDVSQNAINLGWDEVKLPNPVFEGDTIYAQSEVLEKRESKSRPEMGIVRIKSIGYKEDGTVVLELKRTIMVWKKEYAPRTAINKARQSISEKLSSKSAVH
jgi:Acyl dehydratase